jgi:hypothetical protein
MYTEYTYQCMGCRKEGSMVVERGDQPRIGRGTIEHHQCACGCYHVEMVRSREWEAPSGKD